MTKTKSLCSTLISLLLALAVIVAFIPAISLRAEAADPPYSTFMADNYFYGDGWTGDGQTLRFYGVRSFDLQLIYYRQERLSCGHRHCKFNYREPWQRLRLTRAVPEGLIWHNISPPALSTMLHFVPN